MESPSKPVAVQGTDSDARRRRVVSLTALGLGVPTLLVGAWFVGAYVFGAVIDRLGEPDQSLLFWYLPLLFIGVMLLMLGGGATVFGLLWRRPQGAE